MLPSDLFNTVKGIIETIVGALTVSPQYIIDFFKNITNYLSFMGSFLPAQFRDLFTSFIVILGVLVIFRIARAIIDAVPFV